MSPQQMDKGKLYIETRFCGVDIQLYADGSLYLPDRGLLVISDLHLEKGQAQSVAAPLPGFDTDASLAKLSAAIERIKAREVIFLGDSFHTNRQAFQLPEIYQKQLTKLAKDRAFIWITGNHDSELPNFLPGRVLPNVIADGLYFTHQIGANEARISGLICGHYHPKARLSLKLRRISGRCFIQDGRRMILPAFGVFTGGLNILDPAIQNLLGKPQQAHFCHAGRIYTFPVDRKVFLKR